MQGVIIRTSLRNPLTEALRKEEEISRPSETVFCWVTKKRGSGTWKAGGATASLWEKPWLE